MPVQNPIKLLLEKKRTPEEERLIQIIEEARGTQDSSIRSIGAFQKLVSALCKHFYPNGLSVRGIVHIRNFLRDSRILPTQAANLGRTLTKFETDGEIKLEKPALAAAWKMADGEIRSEVDFHDLRKLAMGRQRPKKMPGHMF